VTDFACLNKVELLPWDSWGMTGPHEPVTDGELVDVQLDRQPPAIL
jgi:hypothetical protein